MSPIVDEIQISRVTRSKEDAKASYDKMSRWYDLFASFESTYRNVGLRMLHVKEREWVLEIGFGTGHSILALAQSVGAMGKVYGIDLSEGMCRIAQSRVNGAGLASRVKLECGDAVNLPLANDSFDAIFMSFTLELFDTPEIPIVLAECQRVLKDTGRLGLVAMSKAEEAGWMLRFYEWAHNHFPVWADCRPIFVQKALRDAGFKNINTLERHMWGLPIAIAVATKE